MQPRFELCRQNQIHEHEREAEREQKILRRAAELARSSGEARAVARSHVDAFGGARHRVHRRHLRVALQQPGEHRDLPLTVEPVDFRRSGAWRQSRDVVERHAADGARRDRQLANRRRCLPIAFDGPNVDFVLLPALVVGRDLIATDQQPQRVGGV